MRALIIDDDVASGQVLKSHLAELADCEVALDGLEAIERVGRALAEGRPFDLLFVDIVMPGLDGHETVARIRRVEAEAGLEPSRRAKAVMVSSMDDEDNAMTAFFEVGASAYLVKPVNRGELLAKLATLGVTA